MSEGLDPAPDDSDHGLLTQLVSGDGGDNGPGDAADDGSGRVDDVEGRDGDSEDVDEDESVGDAEVTEHQG